MSLIDDAKAALKIDVAESRHRSRTPMRRSNIAYPVAQKLPILTER
jgi:hypothetical protein